MRFKAIVFAALAVLFGHVCGAAAVDAPAKERSRARRMVRCIAITSCVGKL